MLCACYRGVIARWHRVRHLGPVSLPTEVIAALVGGAAGLLSSAVIEIAKWIFGRRQRAKAIKVALYYEIFRHNIFPVEPSPDGQPNFLLLGFSRASYDAYLAEIPDLLPETLVGQVSTYYADVTLAAAQQQQIEEGTTNVRDAARKLARLESGQNITAPVHPAEITLAKQEGQQVGHKMLDLMEKNRVLLAMAMWQQERLLTELRKEFKHDPAKEPLDVLPPYRAWFKRVTEAKLGKGEGGAPLDGA